MTRGDQQVSDPHCGDKIKVRKACSSSNQVPEFEAQALLGQSFLVQRNCVDTAGPNADMVGKDVRYQERKEKQPEQLQFID
jgi:hypothetical protein